MLVSLSRVDFIANNPSATPEITLLNTMGFSKLCFLLALAVDIQQTANRAELVPVAARRITQVAAIKG